MTARLPRPARSAGGSRRSRTRFVVLGMLTYGPASVYALRQRIAGSVGFFWQESFGQLFPTLARLEREGLVHGQDIADARRRRRDYEITAAGRHALAAWLGEAPAPQPERNELLLKVFFASEGDPDTVRGFVADAEREAHAQLEVLQGIAARLRDVSASDPRHEYRLLTARYGIIGLEALGRWAAEARDVLKT
ncbi:MAG: PadR family transcriptional regulator [Candidatus Limnocylindria bacterium]